MANCFDHARPKPERKYTDFALEIRIRLIKSTLIHYGDVQLRVSEFARTYIVT